MQETTYRTDQTRRRPPSKIVTVQAYVISQVDRLVKSRGSQRRAEPGFIRHRSQRRQSGCCQRCCQRTISGL